MSLTETIESTAQSEQAKPIDAGSAENHAQGPVLNPECTRQVEIEAPAEEVGRSFRQVIRRYQRTARLPGFRAGKVPESYIRARFASQIRQDVIEALLPDHFRAAMERSGLEPVSQPRITDLSLEEDKPLHLRAAFEVLPEFSLAGYEQVTVEKPETSLSEAEVEAELERIRESRAAMEMVEEDRPLADRDFAQVSFTGSVQPSPEAPDQAERPISGQDVAIEVGGASTFESFNTALRGARRGQEIKFETSYPADFGERSLAGRTVTYEMTVTGIKRKILPEMDDSLAKELGDFTDLADFKEKLRQHMAGEKRRRLEAAAKDRLVELLIAQFRFPVPESLVQRQIDLRLDRGLRALAAQGMRTEDMRKLDFERLRAAQREPALAEVKGSILLDRIAAAEGIEASEEETQRELEILSAQTGEPLENLRKRLTADGGVARIRERLRREKTGARLYERQAS